MLLKFCENILRESLKRLIKCLSNHFYHQGFLEAYKFYIFSLLLMWTSTHGNSPIEILSVCNYDENILNSQIIFENSKQLDRADFLGILLKNDYKMIYKYSQEALLTFEEKKQYP